MKESTQIENTVVSHEWNTTGVYRPPVTVIGLGMMGSGPSISDQSRGSGRLRC